MKLPPMIARAGLALAGTFALISAPLAAQEVENFDPNEAYAEEAQTDLAPIDGDLLDPASAAAATDGAPVPVPADTETTADWGVSTEAASQPAVSNPATTSSADAQVAPEWSEPDTVNGAVAPDGTVQAASDGTYGEDDLIGAAEGVFGKGAEGLAKMIQGLLKEQGEPNGYIVGREAGGAFVIGARYGSGTLHHKIEGKRKVYWTGPSIGFDAGANAANTFVLVYNLYDTEELYKRYPAGEGQAYLVGGLNASYMRKGDVVLIPIRVGAGLRLGVNAGYMKFSKKQRWLPF
ncbi:MAG: EipA family protein [Pseudomonadota bacterium]